MTSFPPEWADTPEAQRDWADDRERAIDADEARRPTAAEEA